MAVPRVSPSRGLSLTSQPRVFSLLFPAVYFLVTAARSVDAVLFELPGGAVDCFFINVVAPAMSINGRYETFFGDRSISVSIEGPVIPPDPKVPKPTVKRQELFKSDKETDSFQAKLPAIGFYEICLRNQLSYQQTVTLNFHVAPQAAASPGVKGGASPVFPDVNQLVMSSQTEELKNLSDKVLEMANGLFEQQSNSLARMAVHEELGTSTRNRASLWKAIQMCTQIVLSVIHIYAVRSHFEVKTIV
ncbi:emp24 gp25l p24 family protein [Cystoisospora suis]|uniref:Emp24 gp25l p24 family protein n=1 Tax=Cystoisospora suis TaxID=483139 RepID=A0A2C6KPB6_9APIC|nr:emp24 gp25l p24 family protein [Cystoisospora suis]